jgi:ATP-dependent exoDNAse (exonuclease V) beta subunit
LQGAEGRLQAMSYLEDVPLSPAQGEILSDGAPRALVAAGAGSGKTRLLVAYFLHALLDEGVPFENLAAVTFTRKAGSELA